MSNHNGSEYGTPTSGHRPRGGCACGLTTVEVEGVPFLVHPTEVADFLTAIEAGTFAVAVSR